MNGLILPGLPAPAIRRGGLLASPVIKWLISNEPLLRDRISEYLFEVNNYDTIPFALPAPAEEMEKHRRNRDGYKLMFPQIILKLRRVQHHITKEVGVEVTCSDDDERQVIRMYHETGMRKAIAKRPTLM